VVLIKRDHKEVETLKEMTVGEVNKVMTTSQATLVLTETREEATTTHHVIDGVPVQMVEAEELTRMNQILSQFQRKILVSRST
jgi:hypothetical protein